MSSTSTCLPNLSSALLRDFTPEIFSVALDFLFGESAWEAREGGSRLGGPAVLGDLPGV